MNRTTLLPDKAGVVLVLAATGFSIRARYAVIDQHGGDSDNLEDFRVICNYAKTF